MAKRKATKTNDHARAFAGYKVDEHGRVTKGSKVNWPKSMWIELNELCMRECLSLEINGDDYVITNTIDDEVSIVLRTHSAVSNHIKTNHYNKRVARFKSKLSQGRILNTTDIDFQMSNNYLSNMVIQDNLVKFILKTRLQLLECNSLLHRYYPNSYPKSCNLCNNQSDTASHILNGCMRFHGMYIKRHDRIVNHINQELKKIRTDVYTHVNKLITGTMVRSNNHDVYTSIEHRKPDILILDDRNKKAFIVEISTPFDAFLDQCYHTKFEYYQPLSELITVDTNYTCKIIVIIIGSTGCVHNKVVPGLKMLGISSRKSKAIAKYLSISAAIGSKLVWQQRQRAREDATAR